MMVGRYDLNEDESTKEAIAARIACMKTHVLAIGGAAFARQGEEPVFEKYIMKLTGKKRPKIAFLGTATGDTPRYVSMFYSVFARLDCRMTDIPLFARTPDLRKALLSQDAIFVGGGNTKSMLAVWREWEIDKILKQAWKKGVVMAGVSAGAICWFEEGVTDSWAGSLKALPCLGFLKGSCCPHYSGEKDRRPSYHRLVKSGEIGPGIAIDDGVAAHYVGQKLVTIVRAEKAGKAYAVSMKKDEILESPL